MGDIGFPALSRSLRTPTEVDPAMIVFDIGWNSILVQSHARGGREDQDVAEIVFGSPIVPAQQDPAIIFGGRRGFIQHTIACGHLKSDTHSGGPHFALSALFGFSSHGSFSEKLSHSSSAILLA